MFLIVPRFLWLSLVFSDFLWLSLVTSCSLSLCHVFSRFLSPCLVFSRLLWCSRIFSRCLAFSIDFTGFFSNLLVCFLLLSPAFFYFLLLALAFSCFFLRFLAFFCFLLIHQDLSCAFRPIATQVFKILNFWRKSANFQKHTRASTAYGVPPRGGPWDDRSLWNFYVPFGQPSADMWKGHLRRLRNPCASPKGLSGERG